MCLLAVGIPVAQEKLANEVFLENQQTIHKLRKAMQDLDGAPENLGGANVNAQLLDRVSTLETLLVCWPGSLPASVCC